MADNGFSKKQARTAGKKLSVDIQREGFGKDGIWYWQLPGWTDDQDHRCPIDSLDAQQKEWASMEKKGIYEGDGHLCKP